MNRRQLLLRGALVAMLAPVVRASFAAQPGMHPAAPLLAVHDPAYRRSREFAAALQDRGARVIALEPDVLSAWHGALRAICATTPGARICGLTTHTDFMVLRDFARGAGLFTLAMRDADAGGRRGRATLIGWVLAPRASGA
jgi:hypothetical protein